jgi:hypothetical protein
VNMHNNLYLKNVFLVYFVYLLFTFYIILLLVKIQSK